MSSNEEEVKIKKSNVAENSVRCMHITKEGERCKKRRESEKSDYCSIHSTNPKSTLKKKDSPSKSKESKEHKESKSNKKDKSDSKSDNKSESKSKSKEPSPSKGDNVRPTKK